MTATCLLCRRSFDRDGSQDFCCVCDNLIYEANTETDKFRSVVLLLIERLARLEDRVFREEGQ
jgi:hypothetical protein